ncbi:MAG: aldehyde dehydrogenase family protein [Zoogloeaceae bacterium]|jgi:acyl-CoA reductase-like NAD-dependent aldehyde dehydrogenase|nr:aldehyde dehydrogenase family protein [Zoogloeaceae bacterium]
MSEYALYIDGQAVAAKTAFPVVNPATGAVFAQAPLADAETVESAVAAAARAFSATGWRDDESLRRAALQTAAERLEAAQEVIARLITQEQGRPLAFARAEVAGAVAVLRGHAALPLPEDVILRDDTESLARVERRPLGVVAAITPWNVPVILLALKLAPALLAGNTIVAKPSEITPLSTLRLAEAIGSAFPPGVFNVVSGAAETGRALAAHPAVRKIAFTGSVATGRALFRNAADDFKRLTLELGGNDAALVLEDADPALIAEKIFWGAFWNSGQICFAIKRLYVPAALQKRLLEALLSRARKTVVGDGLEEATELGPLTTATQLERVRALVADAKSRGGVVHTGGRVPDAGFFYPPTLVTGLGSGTPLVDEEQFGPVLPLIPYTDAEAALAEINANPYGLGASVWTSDVERGLGIARRFESGLSWVNEHQSLHPGTPKGGWKWSGLGYEGGREGLEAYRQLQVVHVARGAEGGHS